MAYHTNTRLLVRMHSRQLGPTLGRLAIKNGLSVQKIASMTGASRTTVYSWFAGGTVTNGYRKAVSQIIASLRPEGSRLASLNKPEAFALTETNNE